MPGLLSDIFDEGGGTSADNGGAVDTDLALDVAVAIELSNEMGGTYQNLDGSETTWAREDSLALNVDTAALLSGDGTTDA